MYPQHSSTKRGALSSADWTTFNNKQSTITLTTTGSSGAATLVGSTLNIPNHTLAGLGGIGLTSLSATSPIFYNNVTGVISSQAATTALNGYLTSTDWNTFNGKQAAINGTGFVKATGTTISYDNNTYLTTTGSAAGLTGLTSGQVTTALGFTPYNATNPSSYITTAGARTAISLTTTGTSGAATYNNATGVLNVPNYAGGTGTVTNVSALTIGTTGTDITSTVATGTTTPVITLNVPDASATARGAVTTGTQTLAGAKTLTGATTVSGTLTASNTVTLSSTGSGVAADSLLTVNASGVVRKRKLVDVFSDYAAATVPTILVAASRTSTYTTGAGFSTLVYDNASINVGTAYSTSTGTFTAPATGMYQIIISHMYSSSGFGANSINARIIVNGATDVDVATTIGTAGSTGYGTVNGNTIVQMTSGQTVSVSHGNEVGSMTPVVGTGQTTLKIIRLN